MDDVLRPEGTRLDPTEVCTLTPDGLSERMAWMRAEILPHAIRTERLRTGLAWELAAAPGLAEKLDHLIALERACCAGIVFERLAAATPDRIRLEVRGIDPDAAVFRPLLAPPRTPAHGGGSSAVAPAVPVAEV